tara:strand:- start:1163 stop:1561 length:399 start_codon:yes stop_codon:yes gene_type:complete
MGAFWNYRSHFCRFAIGTDNTMGFKNWLGKSFMAILLAMALLLPASIQLAHSLEGHHHKLCSEQATHLHKTEVKCPICNFHIASFDYKIPEDLAILVIHIPSEATQDMPSLLLHSISQNNKQLRAPPYILVS